MVLGDEGIDRRAHRLRHRHHIDEIAARFGPGFALGGMARHPPKPRLLLAVRTPVTTICELPPRHPAGLQRQYQIEGLPFRLVQDDLRVAEDEPVKADDTLPRRPVELSASPQRIPDPGRL